MIGGCNQEVSAFGRLFADTLLGKASDAECNHFGKALDQVAADWVNSNVKVLVSGVDSEADVRRACADLELSPIFVDAILLSCDGASDRCAALSPDIPFALGEHLSRRVKDVAAALILRGKPILCPFTGTRALVRDSLDLHTFLHRRDGRACVILPDRRVDQFASDRCWFFPEYDLILTSVFNLDVRATLIRTAARVVKNRERVLAYLAAPNRPLMVSEDAMSHIGHYIWNIVSGWSRLYSLVPAERIDILTSYPGWQIFGGVTELYPDQAARAGSVIRPSTEEELYDLILSRTALSLVLHDGHITEEAAQRIVTFSRQRCSDEFHAEVDELRRSSYPLIMLTIRTENRAWVEQKEGYASLICELSRSYPRLGIILDGLNSGIAPIATHGWMSPSDEQAIADFIVEACPDVRIYDSLGCEPSESIVLAVAIDAFLAPIGAGLAKTRWVANKPGVGFSNQIAMLPGNYDLYDRFRDNPAPMRYISLTDVTDVEDSRHGEKSRANFSMSWHAPSREIKALLDTLPGRCCSR